jgi:hypothetical protein
VESAAKLLNRDNLAIFLVFVATSIKWKSGESRVTPASQRQKRKQLSDDSSGMGIAAVIHHFFSGRPHSFEIKKAP